MILVDVPHMHSHLSIHPALGPVSILLIVAFIIITIMIPITGPPYRYVFLIADILILIAILITIGAF